FANSCSSLKLTFSILAAPAISTNEVNVAVEDADAIFAAVGEVPYEWQIDTDRIAWGRNVAVVLPVVDIAALDTGRGYAALIDPKVAVDDLSRINASYGFDVADEVIADIAKRIRRQLRGKDHLGRLSGNKFGIILKNCTPEDMVIAADRLLAGVRDEVVQTSAGPVAATVPLRRPD